MAKPVEVLLTRDVLKLGTMGDTVRVRPGYARNYLIPGGFAVPVTVADKRQVAILKEKAKQQELERQGKAAVLKKQLDGTSIQIPARVAHDDVLFGSVGIRDITDALAATGITVDYKQVHLHENFKKLGRYQVEISLHRTVQAEIQVEVINADPNAPSLDETLAAAAALADGQPVDDETDDDLDDDN